MWSESQFHHSGTVCSRGSDKTLCALVPSSVKQRRSQYLTLWEDEMRMAYQVLRAWSGHLVQAY